MLGLTQIVPLLERIATALERIANGAPPPVVPGSVIAYEPEPRRHWWSWT